MSSFWVQFRNQAEQNFKHFWDSVVKPEVKVIGAVLENLQKELAPAEEAALRGAIGAGIAAAATAVPGGALTLTAAETAVVVGGRAAIAAAEGSGLKLTEQAALTLAAAAGVPTPTAPAVPNGANGS